MERQRVDLVICPDCGRDFEPSGDNEKFCSKCNAIFELGVEGDDFGDFDYSMNY